MSEPEPRLTALPLHHQGGLEQTTVTLPVTTHNGGQNKDVPLLTPEERELFLRERTPVIIDTPPASPPAPATPLKEPTMSSAESQDRPTAMLTDQDGNPLDRDRYAQALEERLFDGRSDAEAHLDHGIRVTRNEAKTAAELLDELAGVYPGEPLGGLARTVAMRLYDRLGI